jgi:hypothetical protein
MTIGMGLYSRRTKVCGFDGLGAKGKPSAGELPSCEQTPEADPEDWIVHCDKARFDPELHVRKRGPPSRCNSVAWMDH